MSSKKSLKKSAQVEEQDEHDEMTTLSTKADKKDKKDKKEKKEKKEKKHREDEDNNDDSHETKMDISVTKRSKSALGDDARSQLGKTRSAVEAESVPESSSKSSKKVRLSKQQQSADEEDEVEEEEVSQKKDKKAKKESKDKKEKKDKKHNVSDEDNVDADAEEETKSQKSSQKQDKKKASKPTEAAGASSEVKYKKFDKPPMPTRVPADFPKLFTVQIIQDIRENSLKAMVKFIRNQYDVTRDLDLEEITTTPPADTSDADEFTKFKKKLIGEKWAYCERIMTRWLKGQVELPLDPKTDKPYFTKEQLDARAPTWKHCVELRHKMQKRAARAQKPGVPVTFDEYLVTKKERRRAKKEAIRAELAANPELRRSRKRMGAEGDEGEGDEKSTDKPKMSLPDSVRARLERVQEAAKGRANLSALMNKYTSNDQDDDDDAEDDE